jgi:prepilin-type N-terminal cleavage/methylation domain-containing protein
MTIYRHPRVQSPDGFTLIELMVVVAILGILVSAATVSYNHFVIKAKTVEGEIVVHEVERLEDLYHASKHSDIYSAALLSYTDDSSPMWRRCHEKTGNW